MNPFLLFILIALIGGYFLNLMVGVLNIRSLKPTLPSEFEGTYDAERYRRSQEYLKASTRFGLFASSVTIALTVAVILAGVFNFIDRFARRYGEGPIPTGLIFAGTFLFASALLSVPFSAYRTFVIEQKYGFNRTSIRTFILDLLKGWFLAVLIGGIVFSAVIWLFMEAGGLAWLYCWIVVTAFQIAAAFVAPILILPLFNELTPLEEGELRRGIEEYARSQGFGMKGVFEMDGSRRSTRSNAFFTGFGGFRRIVLFDTLIRNHPVRELLAILGHEMGHYRKGHMARQLALSILTTGLMFFLLSRFMENRELFQAFRMERTSIYASLILFGFLYSPLAAVISVFGNMLSRRFEYEADAYSVKTVGDPEAMIAALKRMSADNLANLNPNPLKVFLSYSHPPVLRRIQAIREVRAPGPGTGSTD